MKLAAVPSAMATVLAVVLIGAPELLPAWRRLLTTPNLNKPAP